MDTKGSSNDKEVAVADIMILSTYSHVSSAAVDISATNQDSDVGRIWKYGLVCH